MSTPQDKKREEDKKQNGPQSTAKKPMDKKTGTDKKDSKDKPHKK